MTTNEEGQIVDSGVTAAQVNNFIGGQVAIPKDAETLTVTDASITTSSNPTCTIQVPISGSIIPLPVVYNVTNGSFDVEFSIAPAISGYFMNWMSFSAN